MAVKGLKFEVKEMAGDVGQFVGLASTFGNMDAGGDLIEHGAFQKTISDNPQVPILLGHDQNAIIGTGDLRETAQGLEVRGQLILDHNEPAQRAYSLMKGRALSGLSIGYDVIRHTMENGIRHLKELKLYEISLTGFPMNREAMVTAVKTVDHREELAAINQLSQMIRKAMP